MLHIAKVSSLNNPFHCLCVSPHTASGVLKGFDPLLNLVLDGTIEYMRGELKGEKKFTLKIVRLL